MNFLSDNVACKLNGETVRLAIIIEDGYVVFFQRSKASGVLDGVLTAAAGLAGAAAGVVALPVTLAVLAASTMANKPTNLIAAIDKAKAKFKLGDDQIYVSQPDDCGVSLSGRSIPLLGSCTVKIEGKFGSSAGVQAVTIVAEFGERPATIEKCFRRGGVTPVVAN